MLVRFPLLQNKIFTPRVSLPLISKDSLKTFYICTIEHSLSVNSFLFLFEFHHSDFLLLKITQQITILHNLCIRVKDIELRIST